MSSAVVSNAAALRRPFIFDDETELGVDSPSNTSQGQRSARLLESAPKNVPSKMPSASVTPASKLEIRPAPEMVSSGIAELDALTGGLPRGCLTEIYGPASSGRTTVLLAALAAATRRGEFCALIDASDALDAPSIAAAGIDLDRLLWVRCGECSPHSPQRHRDTEKTKSQKKEVETSPQVNLKFDRNNSGQSEHRLEQVLRATDLLLESGGFGLIILDLADLSPQAARRIPMTTWFRFRRAVEYKPTILLAIEQQPIAGSCSSLLLQLRVPSSQFSVLSSQNASRTKRVADLAGNAAFEHKPSHSQLLTSLEINMELIRSRLKRKPARAITFETKTAWAG